MGTYLILIGEVVASLLKAINNLTIFSRVEANGPDTLSPLTDFIVCLLKTQQWKPSVFSYMFKRSSGWLSQTLGNPCTQHFCINCFSRNYIWISPQAVVTWHLYLLKIQLHTMLRFAKALRALEQPGLWGLLKISVPLPHRGRNKPRPWELF